MSDGAIFEHMIDPSGGDGVHRLDVVVSPGGRRRWSPDVKARIISESLVADVNVAEVARRNDMTPQHLYAWRRAAMERMSAPDVSDFVPAIVAGIRTELHMPVKTDTGVPEINIVIGGAVVRVPANVQSDHLERVLAAVRHSV